MVFCIPVSLACHTSMISICVWRSTKNSIRLHIIKKTFNRLAKQLQVKNSSMRHEGAFCPFLPTFLNTRNWSYNSIETDWVSINSYGLYCPLLPNKDVQDCTIKSSMIDSLTLELNTAWNRMLSKWLIKETSTKEKTNF